MANIKTNIIKAIYPEEYENNDNLSDELIEKYYKTDNIYLNAFQVPDQLTNINCGHSLSRNIRNLPIDYLKINDEITYISPLISDSIDLSSINDAYHKLIFGKDIDWENAYLRYAPISYNNLQKPINYYDIDPETGKKINEGYSYSYIYPYGIPERINNTYDLFTIIDYLIMKIKSLNFFLENVKQQNSNGQIYKMTENQNQNNEQNNE